MRSNVRNDALYFYNLKRPLFTSIFNLGRTTSSIQHRSPVASDPEDGLDTALGDVVDP